MIPQAVTSLSAFFFIFVLSYGTSATSILDNVSEPSLASPGEMAGQTNTRSLRTIIWTSLFIISIAAWTSAAPNIPPRPPDERRVLYTTIITTCVIVLAPEFVGVWYLKHWLAARRISGKMRELGVELWSHSHGHFLAMGGFTLVSPDGRLEVLSEERFCDLLRSSEIDLPAITSEDIRDLSKSDVLIRMTAVVHVTWFILRLVARSQQGLVSTHLEILALDFVSWISLLQALIWLKPICAQESAKVYLKSSTATVTGRDGPETQLLEKDFISLADKVFEYLKLRSLIHLLRNTWRVCPVLTILLLPTCLPLFLFFLFTCFLSAFVSIIGPAAKPQPVSKARSRFFILLKTYLPFPFRSLIRQCLRSTLSHDSAFIHLFGWFVFLPTLLVILFPIQLCVFLFAAILLLVYTTVACISSMLELNDIHPGATCFPVFYAPETSASHLIRIIFFPLFGFTFGGIHCIGWNFNYPTRAEQILWRVTSLTITFTPSVISCIQYVYTLRHPGRRRAVHMGETFLLFLYASARLSLIVQAFVLLRDLPPSAYSEVNLSRFIPQVT